MSWASTFAQTISPMVTLSFPLARAMIFCAAVWPDKVFYSTVCDKDLDEIAGHIENDDEPVKRLIGKVRPDVEELLWEILDSPY